jgi:hypothetical protein
MREVKISGDEHHREQEHDCVVVHSAVRTLRRHYSGRNHQDCAEQCGGRAVQRQDFELTPADEYVGDPKDHARDKLLLPMAHTRA